MVSEEDIKIQYNKHNSAINEKNVECTPHLDWGVSNIKCEFDEEKIKIHYDVPENQLSEETIDKSSTEITKLHDRAFLESFVKTEPTMSDMFSKDVKFEYAESESHEKNEEFKTSSEHDLSHIKCEFEEEEVKIQYEGAYQCEGSAKKFIRQSALKINNKIYNQSERCDVSSKNQRIINQYNNIHTEGSDKCFTQKKSLEDTNNHMVEKPYKCETCDKYFSRKKYLNFHMTIHSGEKPFKCETCGHCFRLKTNLKYHEKTHTGEKPYKCETCGKSFTDKRDLNTHIRIHTGENPFNCETCGKTYNYKKSLIIHMRTHTGEKPFNCETCGKSYKHKTSLIIHMRTHTGERPFKCETCGKSFTQQFNLNRHMRGHTEENNVRMEDKW